MTAEEKAVLDAADEWVKNVVVPTDSRSPLTHSRKLINAVHAWRRAVGEETQ